jgi:aspartate/methionine/tyrosine aminotransferase
MHGRPRAAFFLAVCGLNYPHPLEAKGRDIVRLEIGEPDFPTPEPIIAAAQAHIARVECSIRHLICARYRQARTESFHRPLVNGAIRGSGGIPTGYDRHSGEPARRVSSTSRLLVPAIGKLAFRLSGKPEGAFYLYADSSKIASDSERFARDLLDVTGVATSPGLDFSSHAA